MSTLIDNRIKSHLLASEKRYATIVRQRRWKTTTKISYLEKILDKLDIIKSILSRPGANEENISLYNDLNRKVEDYYRQLTTPPRVDNLHVSLNNISDRNPLEEIIDRVISESLQTSMELVRIVPVYITTHSAPSTGCPRANVTRFFKNVSRMRAAERIKFRVGAA